MKQFRIQKVCNLFFLCNILCSLFNILFPNTVSAQSTYFIHSDHLGSTTLITKEGSVVEKNLYYPYGEQRGTSNQALGNSEITEKSYTGQVSDISDSGLLYYNARYYNPTLAKFTQADSMGDGLNKYAYTSGNPLNLVDPTGNMDAVPTEGGVSGGKGCRGLDCFKDKGGEDIGYQPRQIDTVTWVFGEYNTSQKKLILNLISQVANGLNGSLGVKYVPYVYFEEGNVPVSWKIPGMYKDYNLDYGSFYDKYVSDGGYDEAWILDNGFGHGKEFYDYDTGNGSFPIMAFNTGRLAADAFHSYGHRIESKMSQTPYWKEFLEYTGNMDFYDIYGGGDTTAHTRPQYIPGLGLRSGIGNIHFPPNTFEGYDYDSKIKADIPGYSLHGCELWGCGYGNGYEFWWISQIGKKPEWVDKILSY